MRTANDAIAHVFGGVDRYGDVLAEMALKSESAGQRAAAIEGLAKGWPSHSLIDEIVAQGCRSVSLEMKTASLLSKVRLGKQQDVDLTDLLELGRDRFHSGLAYEWRQEIANALALGWAGNQDLKRICLNSCNRHSYGPNLIDRETALSVIGRAFPQDDDVAAMIADQLKQQHSFSSVDSIWQQLPKNFPESRGGCESTG